MILHNIGKRVGWGFDAHSPPVDDPDRRMVLSEGPHVVETRQLWWQIHHKMRSDGYSNMLLLMKMEDILEDLMYNRKQKYITKAKYEELVNKVHLDTEGKVVEPFCELADTKNRQERERIWYENLALEMEEECLIK